MYGLSSNLKLQSESSEAKCSHLNNKIPKVYIGFAFVDTETVLQQ